MSPDIKWEESAEFIGGREFIRITAKRDDGCFCGAFITSIDYPQQKQLTRMYVLRGLSFIPYPYREDEQ